MAHKKGQGSSRNGRDSNAKRRGLKKFGGEFVEPGAILVRQLGTKWHPGKNTGLGRDYTIFAKIAGNVTFDQKGRRISVLPPLLAGRSISNLRLQITGDFSVLGCSLPAKLECGSQATSDLLLAPAEDLRLEDGRLGVRLDITMRQLRVPVVLFDVAKNLGLIRASELVQYLDEFPSVFAVRLQLEPRLVRQNALLIQSDLRGFLPWTELGRKTPKYAYGARIPDEKDYGTIGN